MGGRAIIAECGRCGSVRAVRRLTGLCYSCHWHQNILPKIKVPKEFNLGPTYDHPPDPEAQEDHRKKADVCLAIRRLFSSWNRSDVRGLEEQELASWNLIEKVEDLLGKE